MNDCLFCKILRGEIPAKKLGENEHAIAIADISPQAPFHALILPKRHVAGLNALQRSDRQELLPALYELADELAASQGFLERGYRCVINNLEEGGQTVFHLHMHLLAKAQMRSAFGS